MVQLSLFAIHFSESFLLITRITPQITQEKFECAAEYLHNKSTSTLLLFSVRIFLLIYHTPTFQKSALGRGQQPILKNKTFFVLP
jgi:hypothetical protein